MLEKKSYIETDGVFSHSIFRTKRNLDGHTFSSYEWYYDYYVNGEKYQVLSPKHKQERPEDGNYNNKVLYDVNNPSKSMMAYY